MKVSQDQMKRVVAQPPATLGTQLFHIVSVVDFFQKTILKKETLVAGLKQLDARQM